MSISIAVASPNAIPDLDTLISTVADWLDRDDLSTRIPVFIAMAEALFNRELRCAEMEQTITFPASAEDTPMPTPEFLAMRAIYVDGSPDRPLKAMAPTAIKREFDGTSGVPLAYCLVSGGIRLAPPPDAPVLLTMDYFAKIDSLSIVAPSNWLLEKHPGAYLFGTLFHAEAFLDNATRAAQWKGLLDEIIEKISRNAANNRFGAGPLVPNAITQVRGAIS
jgi:hypothetical protein